MSHFTFVPHQTHTYHPTASARATGPWTEKAVNCLASFFATYMRYSSLWGAIGLFSRVDRIFAFFGAAQVIMTPLVH